MNIKKKAIEPIVATILLVVVAVILVVIVLAWGKNFTNEGLNKAGGVTSDNCMGATIAISNCDWNDSANTTTFLIKNTSDTFTFPADDFTCGVLEDGNITNNDLDGSLDQDAALGPGAQQVLTCSGTNIVADSVTLKVWSKACPNSASADLKHC